MRNLNKRVLGAALLALLTFSSGCSRAMVDGQYKSISVSTDSVLWIEISPSIATVQMGSTQAYSVLAVGQDFTIKDVTSKAEFAAMNPSVARFGANGYLANELQPQSLGTTTVIARYLGVQSTASVTVTSSAIQSIAVSPHLATIPNGFDLPLTAIATYADSTTRDVTSDATWTTSNSAVALVANTVGNFGHVTSQGVGTSTVTATIGAKSDSAVVTVSAATLSSINIVPATVTLAKGNLQDFTASGVYSDGTTQDITSSVTWSSSAPSVAPMDAVTNLGRLTALDVGTSVVSAQLGARSANATVTVTNATLASIVLTPSAPVVAVGLSQALTASGIYTDQSVSDLTSSALWSSSAPTVASVSNSGTPGLVSGLSSGAATITATVGGITGTSAVFISSAAIQSITISPSSATLALGTEQTFTATGNYSNATTLDLSSVVTWSSSQTARAIVSNVAGSRGRVTAVGTGAATLSASYSGITGNAALTVTAATLTGLSITNGTATYPLGSQAQYSVTGTFSDASTQDLTDTVSWTSGDPTVAVMSNSAGTRGWMSTIGTGTTTIGASKSGVSTSVGITVSSATLSSVAITSIPGSIAAGLTRNYAVVGTYSDASTQDVTALATWSVNDVTTASVSNVLGSRGLVTGLKIGSVNLSASYGGKNNTLAITVAAPQLLSIAVSAGAASVTKGLTQSYTATGTYTDSSTANITSSVTWSSSAPAVATINSSGVLTGAGVGSATVTATHVASGVTNTKSVTITPATLVSITVTPGTATVVLLATIDYTATANYTDGSTVNVTSSAVWSTSNSLLAVVLNQSLGRIRAVVVGTATVTATYGGLSGNATIN